MSKQAKPKARATTRLNCFQAFLALARELDMEKGCWASAPAELRRAYQSRTAEEGSQVFVLVEELADGGLHVEAHRSQQGALQAAARSALERLATEGEPVSRSNPREQGLGEIAPSKSASRFARQAFSRLKQLQALFKRGDYGEVVAAFEEVAGRTFVIERVQVID